MESGMMQFWLQNISCQALDYIVLQVRKKSVLIANCLGHSMTYDKVMEIETTQTQKSHKLLDFVKYVSCPSI